MHCLHRMPVLECCEYLMQRRTDVLYSSISQGQLAGNTQVRGDWGLRESPRPNGVPARLAPGCDAWFGSTLSITSLVLPTTEPSVPKEEETKLYHLRHSVTFGSLLSHSKPSNCRALSGSIGAPGPTPNAYQDRQILGCIGLGQPGY